MINNKFDIDLKYGQIFENKLSDIFKNKKVEVKTERNMWRKTGNIAIEYECRGKNLAYLLLKLIGGVMY